MIKTISVVIIVKNVVKTITNTLNSTKDFTNVVIYDNGSTDKTLEIVKSYSNVNVIKGEFLGFGPTKNKAATYAKNDWILSLDADEVIDDKLLNCLQTITLKPKIVYSIFRKNFYKQQHIKHCWGNDVIVRLYHRGQTNFNNKRVHEKVLTSGMPTQLLSGSICHYSYNSVSDFIAKSDIYASEFAKDNIHKKHSSPLKAVISGGVAFLKTYILKRGFLDGYPGLVIAFSHMATNFYKYIRLYELNKDK